MEPLAAGRSLESRFRCAPGSFHLKGIMFGFVNLA